MWYIHLPTLLALKVIILLLEFSRRNESRDWLHRKMLRFFNFPEEDRNIKQLIWWQQDKLKTYTFMRARFVPIFRDSNSENLVIRLFGIRKNFFPKEIGPIMRSKDEKSSFFFFVQHPSYSRSVRLNRWIRRRDEKTVLYFRCYRYNASKSLG